jgi:hypothetical protein
MDFVLRSVRVDGSNSYIHLTPENLHLQVNIVCGVRLGQPPCKAGNCFAVCLSFNQGSSQ